MSSIANCLNHSTSAPISESDNDDENEFDSSFNRQNESMMHKVKDVVSKLLHPSFLFSSNDDTNRPKRKRSTSIEEQQTVTTNTTTDTTNSHTTTSRSKYRRSPARDDEPELTDDEDNNNNRVVASTEQDLTEIEQQKKRRRIANYQHILPTNGHHDHERTFSPSTATNSIRSSSNRRIDHRTSVDSNERIDRLTSATQRFNILPTYRGAISNYDPSKSPLFSAGNRKTTETRTTTTNLNSNEFSANYLLASSLVTRPQPFSLNSQQSPATLTNPNNTNRQMFSVNYSSINSRRLPYIERLRRRTLQDSIRLNRTVDSEPLSQTVIEQHKSTTASPALKRTKVPEKDCGIQCDISIEPSNKIQRTFLPTDIRNEVLPVQINEKTQSSCQTDSSITIEKVQPSQPIIKITKPNVLGDVTPFSWPKFARAQEEYAKKYPEKCRSDAVPAKSVASSVTEKTNVNIPPVVVQQTNTITIPKIPIFPFSPLRPAESIWKCSSCTKEHPAQTAICSLCRGINPNYKKPSATESSVTMQKEPSANQTTSTITKENILSIPPATTTSVTSTTFPFFTTTPITSLPVTTKDNLVTTTSSITPLFGSAPIVSAIATTKENPVTTTSSMTPLFGTAPIVSPITTTKENPVTTASSMTSLFGTAPIVSPITTTKENSVTTTSSITPLFGTAPIVSPITITKENLITTTTSSIIPMFGTTPIVSPTSTTTQDNPVSTSAAPPSFGITPTATTRENSVITSTPPLFGIATFDKTSTTNASSPFQSGTLFQPFAPVPSASLTTEVTSSIVPSIATITPNIPTSSQASASTPFPPFSISPIITTTAAPVVSTVSSIQTPVFPLVPNTSASSLPTSTATTSNLSSSSTITPAPASSATGAFSIPNNFTFGLTNTTSAPPLFGSGGLNLPLASTITAPTSNPPFRFGVGSPPRPFAPTAAAFGTTPSFGTVAPFGTTAPFGITPVSVDRPASSVSSSLSFGTSNTPPSFGFGSTQSTIQTSAAPVIPTNGFTFAPPSSTVPIFGAAPPALSSGGSLNPFNIGATPAVSATNTLFQFSGTTPTPLPANPFATPISSGSTSEPANLFSIGANETSSTPASRPQLRARRRIRP